MRRRKLRLRHMGEAQTMRMLVFLFGVQRSGAIPARVQRVISSQQAASEIIVGLMQCGAIVFFATVYAVQSSSQRI